MRTMWKVYLENHYTHYSNSAKIFFNLTFHILILLLRTTKCMSCSATQDGQVLTKRGPLEKGMANHFSIFALRTLQTVQKGKKIGYWKTNSPGLLVPSIIGEEWRNSSRKKEEMEPRWKQRPVVDVTGDGRKVQCCKEQYCTGTWIVGPWIKANLSSERVRGDTPRPTSGVVAERRYPTSN